MKKFFGKIKNWFKRHKPSKRRLIQVYAALLYNANIKGFIKGDIYKGPVKNMCVPGLNCYSCPGAGAACPLGALQNALASSGTRAPVYVIGIILLFGLILGRTICGFLCPVGLGQELLYKIKTPKLKKNRFTRIFSYFKYVLLLVLVVAIPISFGLNGSAVPTFCKYVCPAGTFGGGIGLLLHPNNNDLTLGSLFTWKFGVMVAIIVASVFIFRFFCRFFCPLGALYGFFNRIALLGVKLDKNKCTDCGLCVNACKMDIKRVGDHECINCGECISVCPTKAIRWKGSKLFVHENAVDGSPAPSEEKPLGALLHTDTVQAVSEPVVEQAVAEQQTVAEEISVAEAPVKDARAREKKRNFWLQFAAWAAALALLVGALVYYNFIYDSSNVGKDVGDECPDFTVELYGEEGGKFTLSEHQGKVTVINFWATWCGPCTEELPDFNRFKVNYPEVEIVAIHGAITEDVSAYIQKYWSDFEICFAQDDMSVTNGAVYSALVKGTGGLPVTVVVDREGKIAYNKKDSMKYDDLVNIVTPLLAE